MEYVNDANYFNEKVEEVIMIDLEFEPNQKRVKYQKIHKKYFTRIIPSSQKWLCPL
jgi:hypothetical protein